MGRGDELLPAVPVGEGGAVELVKGYGAEVVSAEESEDPDDTEAVETMLNGPDSEMVGVIGPPEGCADKLMFDTGYGVEL